MSITDTVTVNIAGTDGSRIQGSSSETGATQTLIDVSISAGVSNQLVAAAFVVANAQAVYLVATQDVTLKTNSAASPGNTITLKANIPYLWRKSAGYNTLLFTVDVTAFYVTTTASSRFQAAILTT